MANLDSLKYMHLSFSYVCRVMIFTPQKGIILEQAQTCCDNQHTHHFECFLTDFGAEISLQRFHDRTPAELTGLETKLVVHVVIHSLRCHYGSVSDDRSLSVMHGGVQSRIQRWSLVERNVD